MKDFFEYIKYPIPIEKTERFTTKIFIKTIGLSYFLSFISSVFLIFLKIFKALPDNQSPEIDSFILFLMIAVIVPFFEEILFRLNLKITKLNISVLLSFLIVITIKLFFFQGEQLYIYLGAIPIFGLLYDALNRFDFKLNKIETVWKSKFKYIFHFFAISFGMMHLTNYETIYWWMIVISPLLTAPYIAIGYLLGFIRMKYGFVYSWLIHSTANFISVISALHYGLIFVLILFIIIAIIYFINEKLINQNSIKILR